MALLWKEHLLVNMFDIDTYNLYIMLKDRSFTKYI